jgi:hypothetical protein
VASVSPMRAAISTGSHPSAIRPETCVWRRSWIVGGGSARPARLTARRHAWSTDACVRCRRRARPERQRRRQRARDLDCAPRRASFERGELATARELLGEVDRVGVAVPTCEAEDFAHSRPPCRPACGSTGARPDRRRRARGRARRRSKCAARGRRRRAPGAQRASAAASTPACRDRRGRRRTARRARPSGYRSSTPSVSRRAQRPRAPASAFAMALMRRWPSASRRWRRAAR